MTHWLESDPGGPDDRHHHTQRPRQRGPDRIVPGKAGDSDPRSKLQNSYWITEGRRYNRTNNSCKAFRDRMDKYFDNRKGYQDEKLDAEEQSVLDKYGNAPLEELEEAVGTLMETFKSESAPDSLISLRLSSAQARQLLDGEKEIEISGFEDTADALTEGKQVFIALTEPSGGLRPGFWGLGHVSEKGHPAGQNKKRTKYAFRMAVDLLLPSPLPRSAFLGYPEAYTAPLLIDSVAFNTVSPLERMRAVKIIKALLDMRPSLEEEVSALFPKGFLDMAQGHGAYLSERTIEYKPSMPFAAEPFIPLVYDTPVVSPWPLNRIIFGAPGTGKSYRLEKERKMILGEDNEDDYERVTFHPDYSYAQFVGTYKPVSARDNAQRISYEFVPGPFLRSYVAALKSGRSASPRPFILIIEEINRASMAAVFGDVFQLLDRDERGVSRYPVTTGEDIREYLSRALGGTPEDHTKLRLPDNLFLWATMNSADQGVFPMDTAFKRRWSFTYLGIDENEEDFHGKTVTLGKGVYRQVVEWNKLRKAINNFLSRSGIAEDKQLGPYFLSPSVLGSSQSFIEAFKGKVLMYLFEDAARHKRSSLFRKEDIRYSEACRAFEEEGVYVFAQSIADDAEPVKA